MKTLQTMCTLSFATTVALFTFACGSANQGPAVSGTQLPQNTTPGAANLQGDKVVVDRLANARCDQEQSCSNIGPGDKFVTREVCMQQLRGSIGNDLNSYDCPRGLDSTAVDRCMAAIRGEECNHPFDTITRYDTCRTGAICMK